MTTFGNIAKSPATRQGKANPLMPDLVSPPRPITLQSLLAPGVAAVRKYWKPFLLLQSAALLLVVGFYTSSTVKSLCEQVSHFKQQGGYLFAAIAAALAGALLPELAKILVLGERQLTSKRLRDIGFALFAFAGNGLIVDCQYRTFGWLLGYDQKPFTILKKVLLDQFGTTPTISIPYILLIYSLRAHRFNPLKTLGQISPRWYLTQVVPLLIPAWCFWIPMVLLIYALPGALQYCLFCFDLAAWSLLVIFLATYEAEQEQVRIED
jgi:hypothetical protein